MRRFLTPRWLGLVALLVVSLVVLVRIGVWQWDKAQSGAGSWQNYGYAVQWWLFAGFAVFLFVKTVLDDLDPSRLETSGGPEPDLPPLVQAVAPAPQDEDDDELAAYNSYLRSLHEKSQR